MFTLSYFEGKMMGLGKGDSGHTALRRGDSKNPAAYLPPVGPVPRLKPGGLDIIGIEPMALALGPIHE